MATSNLPGDRILNLSPTSQRLICQFVKDAYTLWSGSSRRGYMEYMDQQYARRLDKTKDSVKAQLAAAAQDPTKFRNMVFPIIMPQVETAVAYQTEMYCTGVPIFPVVTPPDYLDAGAMLETIIASHAERTGWASEFTMGFRDAFKYNLSCLSVDWRTQVAAIQAPNTPAKDAKKIAWAGNVVERWDLYNTFYDVRVVPSAIATQGDFAGRIELMTRNRVRKMLAELPSKLAQNESAALSAKCGGSFGTKYCVPELGTTVARGAATITQQKTWFEFFGIAAMDGRGNQQGKVGDLFEVVTAYIRICPVDFKFTPAAATYPQVFKVIIVNWDTLVHISPVAAELGDLPVVFSGAYEDGLGYATGSLCENIEDIQQLASAFMNSAIAARRRALVDRGVYNSAVIDPVDMLSDSPVAKIRMKPSAIAQGMKPSDAYYPIPFVDNISGQSMADAQQIKQIGFDVGGQNPAKQGQFMKGNKTRSEFNTIMDFSTSRDRLVALHFETRQFSVIKRHLKYNVIQNQGAETLFSRDKRKLVNVQPEVLRQAVMEFKMGDGLLPSDKLADADTLQVMAQTVQAVPQLQMEYPIGDIFATLMRAGGLDIGEYRYSQEQITYNQQLAAWQQAAAQAAQAGAAFNTPMPQPPGQPQQQAPQQP